MSEHNQLSNQYRAIKSYQRDDSQGILVLGATPIGNLSDTTDRLREHLRTADLIAVEDTRTLRRLTSALEIWVRGQVITNHDHNEQSRVQQILDALEDGQSVLLLSDAGMPTVSDPGYVAVQAAAHKNFPVTILPGPSAALGALAISGLPTGRFTFEGFLARKGKERTQRLKSLAHEERTMIFYESPQRLAATLRDFSAVFGAQRPTVVCRELTKLHEEVIRGSLEQLCTWSEQNDIRGEIVLVVGGELDAPAQESVEELSQLVQGLVDEGMRLKSATTAIAEQYGVSKRELYEATLANRTS